MLLTSFICHNWDLCTFERHSIAIHSYNTNFILGVLIQLSYRRWCYIFSHYLAIWLTAVIFLGKSDVKTYSTVEETGWAVPAYPDTFWCFVYDGYAPASQLGSCGRSFLLKVYKLNPTTSTKKIKDMNNLTNDFTNKQSSILLLVLEMIQSDKGRKSHFWFVFPCFHCQVITIIINSRKYFQMIELQPFCEANKARITSSKSNFLPKCRGFFKVPYDILI